MSIRTMNESTVDYQMRTNEDNYDEDKAKAAIRSKIFPFMSQTRHSSLDAFRALQEPFPIDPDALKIRMATRLKPTAAQINLINYLDDVDPPGGVGTAQETDSERKNRQRRLRVADGKQPKLTAAQKEAKEKKRAKGVATLPTADYERHVYDPSIGGIHVEHSSDDDELGSLALTRATALAKKMRKDYQEQ